MHRQAYRIYKMSENTIKHHGYIDMFNKVKYL